MSYFFRRSEHLRKLWKEEQDSKQDNRNTAFSFCSCLQNGNTLFISPWRRNTKFFFKGLANLILFNVFVTKLSFTYIFKCVFFMILQHLDLATENIFLSVTTLYFFSTFTAFTNLSFSELFQKCIVFSSIKLLMIPHFCAAFSTTLCMMYVTFCIFWWTVYSIVRKLLLRNILIFM